MVPVSGMVSRCSSSRPLTVLGPRSAAATPSPGERADRGTGVGREHSGALGVHVLVRHRGRIGGELADDLLEYVLERHQSLDVAVLVDDEGKPAAVALELPELHVERGSLGYEVRLAAARDLNQPLAVESAAHQLVRHALHVQQADEVVELAFVHRQPRVRKSCRS